MSKPWTPNRPTVELRVSRIRREPPPEARVKQTVLPDDSEHEAWVVAVGILAFALAITVLIFWVSDKTSPSAQPETITISDAS